MSELYVPASTSSGPLILIINTQRVWLGCWCYTRKPEGGKPLDPHVPPLFSFTALHNLSGKAKRRPCDRRGCRYLLHYWISPFTGPFGLEITGNMHSQHCSFSKQQRRPNINVAWFEKNWEMEGWGWVRVFFRNKWEGLLDHLLAGQKWDTESSSLGYTNPTFPSIPIPYVRGQLILIVSLIA